MMTINNLLIKIKEAKNIAIFAHRNPDPDAYGSMFAMREICRNMGVEADIFAAKNKDGYLNGIFPLQELKTDFVHDEYDLVIMLDLHLISRLSPKFIEEVSKCKNIVIIDHHNIAEGDIIPSKDLIINPESAATCEILTDILEEAKMDISSTMATYLYTGLMGDTDRFLHSNLSQHVFETALLLYQKKAEVQKIYDFLYRYKTKEQLSLNKLLLDLITFVEDGKACYAIFTIKDMKRLNADQEDVKVYTNELVKIKGVDLSFLCIDYEDHFKISMRSNKGINTLKLSNKMGGGGHVQASAFEVKVNKRELKKMLPIWAKEILND